MKEAQKGNNMKQLFKSPAFLKKLVSCCLAKTEVSQPHKNCLSNLGVDWMEASQSLQILQICCHMYIYMYNIYLSLCVWIWQGRSKRDLFGMFEFGPFEIVPLLSQSRDKQ